MTEINRKEMKKYPIVAQPKNEIVVYQPDETTRLEVALRDETVWLNQAQMGELFGRERSVVAKHIRNAFKEGELDANSVCAKFAQTAADGKTYRVDFYNLDVIISVGYRVKSLRGTQFRQWATKIIREHLMRGFTINARLAQLEDKVDRRLAKHDQDIVDLRERVDFVVQSALPAPEMVFMEGEFLTAHDAIRKIVKSAKRRIVLIDNYIDERVLTLLSERRKGVACHVYGKNAAKQDIQLAFSRYQQQFPNDGLQLTQWNDAHDRFIVSDDTVWLCGASVKDAGRRMFALVKMTTKPDFILSALPVVP